MEHVRDLLRPHAHLYGPALAKLAYARGLAVTKPDGSTVPIPITATPFIVEADELSRRSTTTAVLAHAGLKMAAAIVRSPLRELLLRGLGPLERAVVESSHAALSRLAITRVDYFVVERAWALELNATIPAMPAYSDIAADTFIEVLGQHAGLARQRISALQALNGSNSAALHRSLRDGFALETQGAAPKRLAILVRRNDAQLTEIRHLAERFNAWGTPTEIVHPDEVTLPASGFHARGEPFDFVYRHLFVRRLEEIDAPPVRDFLAHPERRGAVLFNGPAAHVETKANFALLSQALESPELAERAGLSVEELETIQSSVPWTRLLMHDPDADPTGKALAELTDRVAAEPERYVLKRAWDYGGKAVFIGSSLNEPGFDARVKVAYGEALSWPDLVRRAAKDPLGGGFIVQELVRAVPDEHWVAGEGGLTPAEMYVDYSAYASVNVGASAAWGGVCRGSPSKIVNILGGGGVLPLLKSEVFSVLAEALRARGSGAG